MKNVYILGGILVVIAAAGYWYQGVSEEKLADPATVVEATERAILTPLSADVEMTSLLDPEAWKVISAVSEVEDGAGVRTSTEGRAVIANDLEIITSLDSNSEIKLALSPDKKQTRIELTAGKTWTKIERALEQDEVYEVYTPTMVAAVRGTSFGVSLDPTKSLVVTEGTVRAQQRDPVTGETKPGTEVFVSAGSTLEDNGEVFTVRETKPLDRDDWYVENNPETTVKPVEMIEIDPPAVVIPPALVVPVVEPEPEPEITPTTTPEVEPEPEELVLSIDEVDPVRFDPRLEDRVIVSGSGFEMVDRVTLNGSDVEFEVTRDDILIIGSYELPEKDEVYDIELFAGDESFELKGAFEVVLEEEEELVVLKIEEITSGFADSMEFVIVRGPGMDIVDTILVDNEPPFDWGLFSPTELHIFDTFLQEVLTITVSGAGESDTATP